ncbi:ATP-binding cassette domain-containing protein [Parasphingorhabdus halotolerans]|uniref:ATP-binding cassette domain-containing protein n=1 Tax=Parasphingorhabdus halotolerans TaxID=2725558 RepID=A0A6H2DPA5_9SPHN|nr:ATP-binding cassette domain-containing protein [Parasphingorhabdus halotolerans]QJB70028.1 ATP-binding cassette domain-containing protein [Parasphingorhabdus halotolerans]
MQSTRTSRGPDLSLYEVSRRFGGIQAVDNVSLEIAAGCLVALVGLSGSGKSTLLKMINRLIEPDSGKILIAGDDVTTTDPHIVRRKIGYVFQNIGLFPHMTIGCNIAIGLELAGEDGRVDRVMELLDLVELPQEMASRMPDQLSGGQQQRVGVARALATRPKLMLMDEPFGALDPVTRDSLGTQYKALHEKLGLTTIIVTHDMAEALYLADRILVMEDGQIKADATPAELLSGQAGDEAEALVAIPRAQAKYFHDLGHDPDQNQSEQP